MNHSQPTIQEKLQHLIEKCWEDATFKATLLASPVATIEEFIGQPVPLPAGVEKLVITDQTDAKIAYFNIPARPNLEDVELSDEQLDDIAAGNDVWGAVFGAFGKP